MFGPHAVPTYKEYAGDIHNSGVHLLNLINEILDLSRIEAGRYELNEEPIDLAQVVADCHHLLQLRARNRGISIHEAVRAGPAAAVGGRARLPPDLPQPVVQRDQVHAAGRRDLAQGRLDRGRRPVHEREGQRPGHSGRRDPDRARLVRPGHQCDQVGRTGHRPRPADRQEPGRPARRHVHAQVQAALRHRSDRHLPGRARHVGARAAGSTCPADRSQPEPETPKPSIRRQPLRNASDAAVGPGLHCGARPYVPPANRNPEPPMADRLALHQGLHHRPAHRDCAAAAAARSARSRDGHRFSDSERRSHHERAAATPCRARARTLEPSAPESARCAAALSGSCCC